MKEKTAVIIGGSLGGLMCGIMLRHQGYTVTILERDPSTSQRRSQAAGIAPGPDFKKFLEKYDRTGRPYSVADGPVYVCARDGSVLRKMPFTLTYSSWGLLNNILRVNFDGYTSNACPVAPKPIAAPGKSIYLAGKRVNWVEFRGAQVVVEFTDVSTHSHEQLISDLFIVADGSSSTIRHMFFPNIKRHYAGYITWRGTVPETELSSSTREYMENAAKTLGYLPNGYLVMYKIPSDDGDLAPGTKLINWIWYCDMPEGSPDLRQAMTDINGKEHLSGVPRGLVNPSAWEKQKAIALAYVPAPFAEVLQKTKMPFITKVNNIASPQAVIKDRVFFIGDALNTIRPHVSRGANQAAYHCLMLEGVVRGYLTPKRWGDEVLRQARFSTTISIMVGMYAMKRRPALAVAALKVFALFIFMKFGDFLGWITGKGKMNDYDSWNCKQEATQC